MGEAMFDGVAASGVPRRVGKRRAGGAVVFAEPVAQGGDRVSGEWGDSVLAAFAVAGDVCARAELHVSAGEPDKLEIRSPVWTASSSST